MNYRVLKMMQTVFLSEEASTWDGFFKSIPNIQKLEIDDEYIRPSTKIDLSHLHKKLVLEGCEINSGVWRTLCALLKLEALTLSVCVFESEERKHEEVWKLAYGDEFRSLKFLNLEFLSLVHWIADETNFPNLCRLRVCHCLRLETIPSGIGEIPTLQLIAIDRCRESVMASAKEMEEEEEQSEYGNYESDALRPHMKCTRL